MQIKPHVYFHKSEQEVRKFAYILPQTYCF